jgi:hypothetical protein
VTDDSEWLRRVYLDVVGHIPSLKTLNEFLKDKDPAKRSKVVDALLDDSDYVRNWSTIWTNLSIGRQTPRRVSRAGMQKYYRDAFRENRGWDKIVTELISAEGHFETVGAVNFLLAQMTMPDEQIQATSKAARLLMGVQLQCSQCHNHPFNKWKQDQFWEFNGFFRQARRVNHRRYNPTTGRRVDDYSELVSQEYRGKVDGEVTFERRDGRRGVAYPNFFGTKVDAGPQTNRREELAKLMVQGESPLIAQAMVNRMWGHYFGFGFTRPVDDMGPHNLPAHPELLDRLSREFVASGYDLKKLTTWICNCGAYHLTSSFNKGNNFDSPGSGETALFSRMYVKSMDAEQLYDSLIIATGAHKAGRADWTAAEKQRQRWLTQFVIAFDTDENDEATTFNGTIPQALMMMNGELIKNALSAQPGSLLNKVSKRSSSRLNIRTLFRATLGRDPSPNERNRAQKLVATAPTPLVGYQDLLWSVLNSNEFIVNH